VTLSATHNRLPHWFTEAAAVSEELTGRSYDTAQLLAIALQDNELFAYDQINWGFVRPRKPTDRALAYAQANWMLQYIEERFERKAILDLMHLYSQGVSDADALKQVTSLDTETFMNDFRGWAMRQVERWGLKRSPVNEQAREALLEDAPLVTLDQVDEWLTQHPSHPELLRLRAQVLLLTPDTQAKLDALDAYTQARPVDPWPVRERARLAIAAGDDDAARRALEALDQQEGMSPEFAKALVLLHRKAGRLNQAAHYAQRALHRDPFNASLRELAATVELQRGQRDQALRHVQALTLLEPDRPIHQQRLEALQKLQ
jgi:tetratricopeptide (TPR) repeat protein